MTIDKWIGKTAVITGASAGIGAEIFKQFAKNGINVIGLARRSEKVEEIIKSLGQTKGKAFAYKCDVSNPESIENAFKWIENQFKVVHILVNNAGISRVANILDDKPESFTRINEILDTNVRGLTQCTREAFRLMNKANDYGLIININSLVGHRIPVMEFSWNMYPPSKHAVTAITEIIRQELILAGNNKIRVTSLSPGVVATDIAFASGLVGDGPIPVEALSKIPSLKPEHIAHSVMFLLSTDYEVNISELMIRPVNGHN